MAVRAKFRVSSITEHDYVGRRMKTIELTPVMSNDPGNENKSFWDATPSGVIKLGTVSMEAASQFDVGREYYIDFTLATPDKT
jgi:hypothetical protein